MKTLTIWGESDDLVEIDLDGSRDEFSAYEGCTLIVESTPETRVTVDGREGKFIPDERSGVFVRASSHPHPWAFAIAPFWPPGGDGDSICPLPDWAQNPRIEVGDHHTCDYSTVLIMTVPDSTTVRELCDED